MTSTIANGTKVRIIGTHPAVFGTVVAQDAYAGEPIYHVEIPNWGTYAYGPELLQPVR